MVWIILVLLSLLIGFLGMNRKFGFWGYFLISIFLTPLIGLLVLFASDKKTPKSIA